MENIMHFNNRFSTYKNINIGRTAVVFGSGPTLNLFDSKIIPEKDALFVGVNSLVFKKDITLDYYFCGHDSAREPHHLHHITLENTLKEQIISSKINRQIFCATHVDGRQHPLHFDFKDDNPVSKYLQASFLGDDFILSNIYPQKFAIKQGRKYIKPQPYGFNNDALHRNNVFGSNMESYKYLYDNIQVLDTFKKKYMLNKEINANRTC